MVNPQGSRPWRSVGTERVRAEVLVFRGNEVSWDGA